MGRFKIEEYLSKELVLTLLTLFLSAIIYFAFNFIDANSEFNDKVAQHEVYVNELKTQCSICSYINSRSSKKKEIQKILGDSWVDITAKDSLRTKNLTKILKTLSKTKGEIVTEISSLRKYEDVKINNEQDRLFQSEMKIIIAEKNLVIKLEEHGIFLLTNGINANDLAFSQQSKDLVLELLNESQSSINKEEYDIQHNKNQEVIF